MGSGREETTGKALKVGEAADLLGISCRHLQNLIRRGLVRSILLGRCRRISECEVRRILANGLADSSKLIPPADDAGSEG